jgi:hypothetical protein
MLAERKELARILAPFDGQTLTESATKAADMAADYRALRAALSPVKNENESLLMTLGRILSELTELREMPKARPHSPDDAPHSPDDAPPPQAFATPTPSGPIPGLPVDNAFYPAPGQSPPPPPPAHVLTAQLGEMGPAYIRWFLSTNGPAETAKKYGRGTAFDRTHLLPPDVQKALQ